MKIGYLKLLNKDSMCIAKKNVYIFIIIILFYFFSCTPKKILFGKYNDRFNKIIFVVNQDSTFNLSINSSIFLRKHFILKKESTCIVPFKILKYSGKWRIINNKIILYTQNINNYPPQFDTIPAYATKINENNNKDTIKLRIEHNKIILKCKDKKFRIKYNTETKKSKITHY